MLIRHGTAPFRLGWARAGSTVLCGLLLIGANATALRRRAPRPDRARLADLRLGAALARGASLGDRRPAATRLARRDRGRVPRGGAPAAARRGGDACRACCSSSPRRSLGDRDVPLLEAADAGRRGHDGGHPGPGGRAAPDSRRHGALGRRVARPGGLVDPLAARAPLPDRVRLDLRLHGLRLAGRERAARHGRDLRVRQPARRDHPRRRLPPRGGDVADRRRCRGDPDLGRRRDPPRDAAAPGRRAARRSRRRSRSAEPGRQAEPRPATGRRSRPAARARGAAACRSRRASPPRRRRSRRRWAARRRP